MPTVENWDIDTDGTGDYSSLSAFESTEQQDLVTNDIQINANCSAGGGAADTTNVNFSGWTTDATRYIQIVGTESHGGKWNTSNYRLEYTATTSQILVFSNGGGAADVYIRNLQVARDNNGRGINLDETGGPVYIERCLLRKFGGSTNPAIRIPRATTVRISNCIIFGDAGGSWGSGIAVTGAATLYCYNNLAHACGGDGGFVVNNASATYVAKNCCADDCSDGFNAISGSFDAASDYNASDIASDAPGSNSQNGTDTTFVDEANEDYHLSTSDTVCLDNGTDLSGDSNYAISVDNENATRTGTWDIGPHQAAAAAGARRIFVVS